jgi:hypothetical protein
VGEIRDLGGPVIVGTDEIDLLDRALGDGDSDNARANPAETPDHERDRNGP